MKKKLLFLVSVLLCFISCSTSVEEPSRTRALMPPSAEDDYAMLIQGLTMVNDSLAVVRQGDVRPEGFGWLVKIFVVAAADVKGAFAGYEAGKQLFNNEVVGIVGAIVGGVTSSWKAGEAMGVPSCQIPRVLQYDKIEDATIRVLSNPALLELQKNLHPEVESFLSEEYQDLEIIGQAHNLSLSYMSQQIPNLSIKENSLPCDYETISSFIASNEFSVLYNCLLNHSEDFFNKSLESNEYLTPILSNSISAVKIVDLFLDSYRECQTMDEVNELVHLYYTTIERQTALNTEQRRGIYSCLITASYSAAYWFKNYDSPAIQ